MEALLRIVAASNWHKVGRGIRVAVIGKEREVQHIDVLREVIQVLRSGSAGMRGRPMRRADGAGARSLCLPLARAREILTRVSDFSGYP